MAEAISGVFVALASLLFVFLFVGFFMLLIVSRFLPRMSRGRKRGTARRERWSPLPLSKQALGRVGEYLTYKELRCFENDGAKFLSNVYIPLSGGGTTEIDLLMISKKGLFVLESKNYSGWIFGSENQRNWYQALSTGRGRSQKRPFYNPIMQNRTHLNALGKVLYKRAPLYSVIVFSERCTLKSINVQSNDVRVIKRSQVFEVVSNIYTGIAEDILTGEDIVNIYNKLYLYTKVSKEEKAEHIARIQHQLTKDPAVAFRRDAVREEVEKADGTAETDSVDQAEHCAKTDYAEQTEHLTEADPGDRADCTASAGMRMEEPAEQGNTGDIEEQIQ